MPDDSLSSPPAPCFFSETDIVVATLDDTRQYVLLYHVVARSWRKLADHYGLPHNVLYAIGTGRWAHVSWDTVRLVRQRLGLSDPGELRHVPACPIHGVPHLADCHGAEVAAVVTLAPGETVRRRGKPDPRPPCYRPRLSRDPAVRIRQLEALLAAARQEVEP